MFRDEVSVVYHLNAFVERLGSFFTDEKLSNEEFGLPVGMHIELLPSRVGE